MILKLNYFVLIQKLVIGYMKDLHLKVVKDLNLK